jgi:phosphate-selective porin OprO and OprP
MRKHRWWRSASLSAALFIATATSGALAQNSDVTNPVVTEPYDAPYAPAAQATDDAAELRQRIDALGREVADLRTQLRDQQQAQAASVSTNADAAAEAPAGATAAAQSPLKVVPTIVKPTVTVYGRMFFDHIMYDDPPALFAATGVDRLNETGFNTVRIGAKGNAWENVLYQVEVEFEGSETDFKDCFIEATNCPLLGNVRVGHYREPFSLEESTSSRFITFMQRSIAHSALVPSRNFGVMAYDYLGENENLTWFMGTFRHDSPDNPTARASHISDSGDMTYDARVGWNPYYDEPSAGRYLVHIGGAYSYRTDSTVVAFLSRPELGSQAGYLSTTFLGDRDYHLFGGEAAIVWGPGSLQAEYYSAHPDDDNIVNGGYIQYSHFLTGESRGYNRHTKVFDRVTPIEDFFRVSTADGICMGHGAWELKARYSWLDMSDGDVGMRGDQDDFTAGANWYWNPYTRMMFDWVYEDVSLITGVADTAHMVGMRFQIDY